MLPACRTIFLLPYYHKIQYFCWFVTTMRYCVILIITNKQGGKLNRNEIETFTQTNAGSYDGHNHG